MNKKNSSPKNIHTLIIGSGAAGLNAAVQLHRRGITDLLIITEGLKKGTSINTGSDKQTYYKLSMCADDADAPALMAENYFSGGSMHGDLALVEASVSAQAFLNLVSLGVKFPQDAYGQFAGYKTDHDPRKRATSVGPYTSRDMCLALIAEVKRRKIKVLEKRDVIALATTGTGKNRRAAGAIVLNDKGKLESYSAENIVFATGGPGGLYKTSVYPAVHTGGIGLAMLAGAKCQSLPEAQYGLASTKFRWNVSGTYMQVIPRFISTDQSSKDEKEFLPEYFNDLGEMNTMVFLKGYQWPFDPRKVKGGSSIIDILVYIETVIKGRRVWLDFRSNPGGYKFSAMGAEARDYLKNSEAHGLDTPIKRLRKMNPGAIELYKDHKIDITRELLEIAVCAQHNNGGLAGNHWWESINIKHLFPVGEVNGSHGVYRPGGSALNSGQVASIRAAEFIANRYADKSLKQKEAQSSLKLAEKEAAEFIELSKKSLRSWREERNEFQKRMSEYGAHIRSAKGIKEALKNARKQWNRIRKEGGGSFSSTKGMAEALRNRQLCFAHLVYLEAELFQLESGVGSRGSALALSKKGIKAHNQLDNEWRFAKEDDTFREKVLETDILNGKTKHRWVNRRPIPQPEQWFETVWADFREGRIYK